MNKRIRFFYVNLIICLLFFCHNLKASSLDSRSSLQSISCLDQVQIAFDETCQVEVIPEYLLTSEVIGTYTIEVYDGLELLPEILNVEYAYIFLNYTISSNENGNSCSGILMLVDNISPVFDCPQEPIQVSCGEDLETIAAPLLLDNCTNTFDYLSNEIWFDTDFCDDGKKGLVRVFQGVDYFGNSADECLQLIEILRDEFIDFPNDVVWSCDQYAFEPSIVDTQMLAVPFLNLQLDTQSLNLSGFGLDTLLSSSGSGIPMSASGFLCDFSLSSSDVELSSCGSSFVIIRTWLVLDWCSNEIVTSNSLGEDNIQLIFVSDLHPPNIQVADSIVLNAGNNSPNGFGCTTMGFVPPPVVSDNCSSYEIRIFCELGELIYENGTDGSQGGTIPFPGLDLGAHSIEYRVKDACNNIATLEVPLMVNDISNPVMVTVPSSLVSLNELGLNEVMASTFDQGSFDNCCLDYFEIKKQVDLCGIPSNLEYSESVQFCCSEVGLVTPVIVKAVDCFGNFNEALISVFVQDNLNPQLVSCPSSDALECDIFLTDYLPSLDNQDYSVLAPFGAPVFEDNCSYSIEYEVSLILDDCNEGYIERLWSVKNAEGLSTDSCIQQITINHADKWSVQFQDNLTVDCLTDTLGVYQSPTVFNEQCALISSAFTDVVFDGGLNTCYSFFREWIVINWCTYDINEGNILPDISEFNAQQDFNNDGFIDSLVFKVATGLQGESDGVVQFTQIINIIDENPPVVEVSDQSFCLEESNCLSNIMLESPAIEDCSSSTTLLITTDLPGGGHLGPYNDVPLGNYTATYKVTDQCENSSSQTVNITVTDCIAPVAICQDSTIQITANDSVLVYAEDLAFESVDNCINSLSYTFNSSGSPAFMSFLCGQLGEYELELSVSDESGNIGLCTSVLSIVDTIGYCLADNFQLAGAIMTEQLSFIESVEVEIEEIATVDLTDEDGYFEFNNLNENDTLTLRPHYDGPVDQGVTTFDVVMIKLHILQVDILDSPYKLIAADVNNNGTISTIDIVALRKVILGLTEKFPNNESWRFVPLDYEFSNPTNPFQDDFPDYIRYGPLQLSDLQSDFYAIKIGDVNNSINLNSNQIEQRNNVTHPIILTDQDLVAGQLFPLSMKTKLTKLSSLQGRIYFDIEAIELVGCKNPVSFNESNFNTSGLCEGKLTFIWDQYDGTQENNLFPKDLLIKAKKACKLSEVIRLDPSFVNEAYFADADAADLNLQFKENYSVNIGPNPFRDRINIFLEDLESNEEVHFRLYGTNGILLIEKELEAFDSKIVETIEFSEYKGLLVYELDFGDQRYSGRLIAY